MLTWHAYVAVANEKEQNGLRLFRRLSDGKNSVLLYAFYEAVQQKLSDHRDSGESVLLSNCEVKHKEGQDFEVTVRSCFC